MGRREGLRPHRAAAQVCAEARRARARTGAPSRAGDWRRTQGRVRAGARPEDPRMTAIAPDEAAIREDLESWLFRKGVKLGKWGFIGLHFPELYISVTAPPRPDSPSLYLLRLDVQGFRSI